MLLRRSAHTQKTFSFLNFFGHCGLFPQDFGQGRTSFPIDFQKSVRALFVCVYQVIILYLYGVVCKQLRSNLVKLVFLVGLVLFL